MQYNALEGEPLWTPNDRLLARTFPPVPRARHRHVEHVFLSDCQYKNRRCVPIVPALLFDRMRMGNRCFHCRESGATCMTALSDPGAQRCMYGLMSTVIFMH